MCALCPYLADINYAPSHFKMEEMGTQLSQSQRAYKWRRWNWNQVCLLVKPCDLLCGGGSDRNGGSMEIHRRPPRTLRPRLHYRGGTTRWRRRPGRESCCFHSNQSAASPVCSFSPNLSLSPANEGNPKSFHKASQRTCMLA